MLNKTARAADGLERLATQRKANIEELSSELEVIQQDIQKLSAPSKALST